MAWVYISIILLMRVVQNIFTKSNVKLVPKNSVGYLKYTIFYIACAAIPAFLLFVIEYLRQSQALFFWETLLYASISGVSLAISCCCSLYALSTGTMVLNSLFATAGLLVPSIAGIFLWQEYLSFFQYVAIVVFIVGAYLLIGSSKDLYGKFSLKTLCVLVVNLITNGLTMLMQTIFARNVSGGSVSMFSLLSFLSGALILSLVLVVVFAILKKSTERETVSKDFQMWPTKGDTVSLPKKVYLGVIFLAIAVFVINQLATMSANMVSPVVLFAFINGGATIISSLVGAIMYKEKFTIKSVVGLILGVSALILIKVFSLA